MKKKTPAVLALDLGTGGIKASLVGHDCRVICGAFSAYPTYCSPDGRREQRPGDWWRAAISATRELLAAANGGCEITAVGISGHSMGRVPVGCDGELLEEYTPIWSDSRARAEADDFFCRIDNTEWYMSTGNGSPPPHYAVFKIMRLMRLSPELYSKTAVFLGTKDYVNMKLCGAVRTDFSYASGSGLFDLAGGDWRDDYIAAAGIDRAKLPVICKPDDIIGYVTPDAADALGIPAGIPVTAGGVDNGCMALGAGCIAAGDAYCSLGSSAWIAAVSDKPAADTASRPYIFAHCLPGLCLPHQGIFSSGTSHDWVIDRLFGELPRDTRYRNFDALACTAPVGSDGLLFCPALAGGSAADPSPEMRGGFVRLDLSHTRADIARATVEGIILQLHYVSEAMLGGSRPAYLRLTGGGAKSRFWRQTVADVFGCDVAVTDVIQGTATLGAAALALTGTGIYDDFSFIGKALGKAEITRPDAENSAIYNAIKPRFAEVMKALGTL